jgi:radical SAM superfamily enzyme YgiQ (UPF0313 family)
MKLLLVDNLIMPEKGSGAQFDMHPHLGLLALATAAEADGHKVVIYDPKRLIRFGLLPYDGTLYERVANDLMAHRPDAIGFTTLGCSFLFAVNVAKFIKARESELPILLGGPHATMLHREILERFSQFDIVVRHEADEGFSAVLSKLERRSFDGIPGISWRASSRRSALSFTEGKPKVEDLDLLPITSYDHYPVKELGLPLLRVEAGRGCPFLCTFCSTASFFQRSFRLKSAERIVRELDVLHSRYGYRDFKLDHDMFTVNRRKVLEFCSAVSERGYRWRVSARVDCVDEQLLVEMANAGCVSLYFGIETGSQRMQRICKKRLDLRLVDPILRAAAALGIETTASFITGYPEETHEDQTDTLDLLGRCARHHSCLPQLHILTPEPATELHEKCGHEISYDGYGGPYNVQLLGHSDASLILRHPEIFQTYYYYPGVLSREQHIFAVEAMALLRRIGSHVLGYTLRGFDGQLSLFVYRFRQFCEAAEVGRSPNADLLIAFIHEHFGADHHITSLFRLGLRLQGSVEAPVSGRSIPLDADALYVLAPGVEILEDIHDCASIVERIKRLPADSAMLADSDGGERCTLVVQRRGDSSVIYSVDPGVAVILSQFESPCSCRRIATWLQQITGGRPINCTMFDALVHYEMLVRAEKPPFQSIEAERATGALAGA